MYKKSYTMREMKDIVKYVVHNNAYAETKGRQFWQKCASSKKTNRTWQSLKETFLKRILTDIANPYYELTQEQIDCFRSGSSVNRRLLNKLEWHNSDSEAGPSNEMENHSSVNDEKKQNPDDKVAVPTLQQGELADSQVCRGEREDSDSRDTLKLYSNDEGNQKENEDDANSDETLVIDKNDQTENANFTGASGCSSKLKDKLIFLEPLTPMMQDMVTDSDISNSSESTQEVSLENEPFEEKDASSKENKENEIRENMDSIKEKDKSDMKILKSTGEKVEHVIEKENVISAGNSNITAAKKDNCKNQKNDKTIQKLKLKKKVSENTSSSWEMQASIKATGENVDVRLKEIETNGIEHEIKSTSKLHAPSKLTPRTGENDDVRLKEIETNGIAHEIKSTSKLNAPSKLTPKTGENDDVRLKEIETNGIEHKIKSTSKLNAPSKLARKSNRSDQAIVDVNEIITIQTSTRLESIHTKGSESKSANKEPEIPSFSIKGSTVFLKSSSDSLPSSDDVEVSHATCTVRKAEISKSKGLAKVFGLVSGEKDLKLVTSKKYRMNQSSKASPNNSIRNKLSVLSSWDSDSSSSASDTKMEHVSHRLRNYQHIAQPTEIKSHIKNGMLMAICGNQMYPVMKQVGSKRHYVKWKDDGTNEIIIAKKCKESNNRYSTKRGEHETNNYHINLSTSSECDSDGNSFHKMPRYTTEKVKPKYRYRRETSSTPNDKWKNEFLLQKKKNDQLMGLLDQLLELKNIKSHLENGQELKDVNPGPSSTPVVQEESVKIDLTHEDQKKADEDNVLKISASYGEKVVQMEVKDDDMTNPLQKVLEVLRSVQKNVTDAVQEKEHAKHENKEVQARVDKLEETIFNTIIELDKHELNDEPKAEERQVENNQTEVDPSLNSCPAINVINEDVNTQGEAAKVASSRRSSKKRRPEDTKTVETQKLKQSPRLRKKETLSVPTRQETEGTATVPTSQESEVSTIIVQTAQEIDVPNAPKTYQTKRRTKRRPGPAESIVEGNVLSKSVSTEEIDVSKEHAIESTQVTLDDSDQEIIFTKESLSKRSSVDSKSPRITRQNRSRQQDTSSEGLKSEDLVNTLRQSQRTRSNDHKEKTHISNSLHYPNRSQNKDMKRKK